MPNNSNADYTDYYLQVKILLRTHNNITDETVNQNYPTKAFCHNNLTQLHSK